MEELKPCPFCGGKACFELLDEEGCEIDEEMYELEHDEGQTYEEWLSCMKTFSMVVCSTCNVHVSECSTNDAVTRWNRRVSE